MPGPLTRLRQLAVAVEDIEGTAKAPTVADAKIQAWGPKGTWDIPMFARTPAGASFGRRGSVAGKRSGTLPLQVELRGSGTAGVSPQWFRMFRSCGWEDTSLNRLTIGAITGGPLLHGETVTQSVSGATARVVKDTATGTTTLYLVDLFTGTWNGTNGITGGESGATATPSAYAAAIGRELKPYSELAQQVNIGAVAGGPFTAREILTGGSSGAKGELIKATATGFPYLRYVPISGQFTSGEVVTGGSSGATATTSSAASQDANPSVSAWLFAGTKRRKFRGVRGKWKLALKAGEPGMLSLDMMGVRDGHDDVGPFASVSHETTTPPTFLSALVSWNAYSARIDSLEVDGGGTVSPVADANTAEGISAYRVTQREITGKLDPEAVKTIVQDWPAQWLANTEVVFSCRIGTASGNSFELYAKKVQIEKADDSEREGQDVDELSIGFNRNRQDPGDDDLTILAF